MTDRRCRGRRRDHPSTPHRRQAAVVERLLEAAADETRVQGYEGVTVRSVARRAGVAPATAYTYFAPRTTCWPRSCGGASRPCRPAGDRRRAGGHPGRPRRGHRPRHRRLRVLGLFMADDPTLAAACTTALLGRGPDVRALRVRFGSALHARLAAALGDAADEAVLRFSTSLAAGPCCGPAWATSPSRTSPAPWPTWPDLSSGRRRHDRHRHGGPASTTAPTTTASTRTPIRPTPGCGPRPPSTATTSSTSGPCRATRTCWPPSATRDSSRTASGSRSTPPPTGPTPTGPCRSWPWTRPPHPDAVARVARPSRRGGWPSSSPDPRAGRRAPRRRRRGGDLRLHRRLRRHAADGRDLAR